MLDRYAVMAYIVMATCDAGSVYSCHGPYSVANIVMGCIGMAHIGMVCIGMGCIGMAHIVP